jgi:hypothetical protein
MARLRVGALGASRRAGTDPAEGDCAALGAGLLTPPKATTEGLPAILGNLRSRGACFEVAQIGG